MAVQIKNIVQFVNIAPGVIASLPHGVLDDANRPTLPDRVEADAAGFEVITVTTTHVTVRNVGPVAASVNVLCELWHTIERAFGNVANLELSPRPYIATPGGVGGGGGNPVAIEDEGAWVGTRSTINFVGAGVVAVDDPGNNRVDVVIPGGGGADATAVLGFGVGNIGAPADTRFLDPWFGDNNGVAATHAIEKVAPRAGTVRNLHVRHNTANGNGALVAYEVLLNGVATGLLVSLATGAIGQAANLVNSFAVVQGDRLALRATKALPIGNGRLEVSATMELA